MKSILILTEMYYDFCFRIFDTDIAMPTDDSSKKVQERLRSYVQTVSILKFIINVKRLFEFNIKYHSILFKFYKFF